MVRKLYIRLFVIIALLALAIWIDLSKTISVSNPLKPGESILERDVAPRLGLDLRGGLQVVMEVDLPEGVSVSDQQMADARSIIENRTNALGVAENLITVAGDRRIVGEFPGLRDSSAVLATIQQSGVLEFVDMGSNQVAEGEIITTDFGASTSTDATPSDIPTATATTTTDAGTTPTATETATAPIVYHTVMTGEALDTVGVQTGPTGEFVITFTLKSNAEEMFAEYTGNNVGKILAIVLDKRVISAPKINQKITGGEGIIEGQFTYESANALAIQLRYGSLPVPLKIVETRIIGPTLGEDSLQKSLIAGIIGMIIVILFMALYYRLPGIVADISILIYAALALGLFKYIHVTLTLSGIAGILLSTGAALDANILVFERIKEELRGGLNLASAVDKGWKRAWPSIRDANIATIITSLILLWFGSTFGATIVKGFSITLMLGVGISLFTALFVTRTLLSLFLQWFKVKNLARWFGI